MADAVVAFAAGFLGAASAWFLLFWFEELVAKPRRKRHG